MTTTRLRRTFRYPDDGDENLPDEGIDEQEQEKIIDQLYITDVLMTAFYRKAFLALPSLGLLYFIIIVTRPSRAGDGISSSPGFLMLCMTSLCLSFWTVYDMKTEVRGGLNFVQGAEADNFRRLRRGSGTIVDVAMGVCSTVRKLVVVLNGLFCAVLVFGVWRNSFAFGSPEELSAWSTMLPLSIFVVTAVVRAELRVVDVESLKKLKYDYRGA